MKLLNNDEINTIMNIRQTMEVDLAWRLVGFLTQNYIAHLRVLMWDLVNEITSNVNIWDFNRVMRQNKGNQSLEIWTNNKVPSDYYGLITLKQHCIYRLNIFDCSDLIRLYGEFAEALEETHPYWRARCRDKAGMRPFPTFLDPEKARKVSEEETAREKRARNPHFGWGKTAGGNYFGHRNRTAAPHTRPGMPGLDRWRFCEQSVIGAIDRTFGLKERGSDVSGTTADSIYVLNFLGEQELNRELLDVLQMLPMATMGAKRHHSILECAYVLSRWKYMDYHIGYYTSLVPENMKDHARVSLESVLLPYETSPRNTHLLVWGLSNNKCGLLFDKPEEKREFKKMSRALNAYGFCVAGGFRNWEDAARVLNIYSQKLRRTADKLRLMGMK